MLQMKVPATLDRIYGSSGFHGYIHSYIHTFIWHVNLRVTTTLVTQSVTPTTISNMQCYAVNAVYNSGQNVQGNMFYGTLILQLFSFFVGIVVPPKSVDSVLNRTVNFTCSAVAQEIEWEVNGQTLDSVLMSRGFDNSSPLITLNATQNLRTRKLPVLASAVNNNTNITCLAYFLVPVFTIATSEPAVLLVLEPGMNQKQN